MKFLTVFFFFLSSFCFAVASDVIVNAAANGQNINSYFGENNKENIATNPTPAFHFSGSISSSTFISGGSNNHFTWHGNGEAKSESNLDKKSSSEIKKTSNRAQNKIENDASVEQSKEISFLAV